MKIVCIFLTIILFLAFAACTFVMQNNTLIANVSNVPALNSVIYSILIFVLGFLAGFILNQGNIEVFKANALKQVRKAEKSSIDTQESLDKIDRLNAKIETLEVALQEALKNKKQS